VTESAGRGPNVSYPPPLWFVAGFVVGWLVDRYLYHLWPIPPRFAEMSDLLGGFLFGAGLALGTSGVVTFRRAKTAVFPNRDASHLVVNGPYRFTRNPDYLGLSFAYVGISILTTVGWALVLLPLVLLGLSRFVIAREERYLVQAFGDEYLEYQRKVGRWW
jgi:protein-S-isoprenylcysteine O-methyltransferase Ste14